MYLIDVAKHDLLHGLVLEHLAHDTAVTAADNENFLWVWVARQRYVCDHLLVSNHSRNLTSPIRDIESVEKRTRTHPAPYTG